MAPLCKFFQQGNCRNGANCRFEHPRANTNPFGALSNNSGPAAGSPSAAQYKITPDSIKTDLADERPTWILSSYGPGKDAPEQLFGGYPLEQSLEEIRLHVLGSANQQQAMAEVQGLYAQAEQQMRTSLNDTNGAIQFIVSAEGKHPNRIDLCNQNTIPGGTNGTFSRDRPQATSNTTSNAFGSNAFGSNAAASSNPNPFAAASSSAPAQANPFSTANSASSGQPTFSQPSALGQKPNPFGSAQPQFGQPSQMGRQGPVFGQTSQMGASTSAFGKPAAPAGQAANPFSQAAGNNAPSGFGQLGGAQQNSSAPNPFGQNNNANNASPFAQLGQQKANPFGAPPAPAAESKPNPFGQPANQPTNAANPFAQATAPASQDQSMDIGTANPTPAVNAFAKPAGPGFGAPAQPSGFGNTGAAAAPNPFAQAANPNPNPFGQAQSQPPAQAQANAGSAATKSPYPPGSSKSHPPPPAVKSMNGQITQWNNLPVAYKWKVGENKYDYQRPDDGSSTEPPAPGLRDPTNGAWRKIWFPDGPPAYNRDTEPQDDQQALNTAQVRAAYARMAELGRFEGDMPEVPPMREECLWTF